MDGPSKSEDASDARCTPDGPPEGNEDFEVVDEEKISHDEEAMKEKFRKRGADDDAASQNYNNVNKKLKELDDREEELDDERHVEEQSGPCGNTSPTSAINYTDLVWFDKVTKTCQVCETLYKTSAEASHCLKHEHRRFRCYLCFINYYRNTTMLYRHYASKHRDARCNEEQVICPYCEELLEFENVACHVISNHVGPFEEAQRNGELSSFSLCVKDNPHNDDCRTEQDDAEEAQDDAVEEELIDDDLGAEADNEYDSNEDDEDVIDEELNESL